jgi:hypothetical protein
MQTDKEIDGLVVRRSNLYPNYGCSSCGAVYRWDTEKQMSIWLSGNPRISEAGRHDKYLVFRTSHNNNTGFGYYHKILADCWIPNDNPELKTQVNHKDGDKENCVIDNLEWVTPSQNQRHALAESLKQKGQDLYNSSLTDSEVHQICRLLEDGLRPVDIHQYFPQTSRDVIRKIASGDCYMHIRVLYPIKYKYRSKLSEHTVRWICERINDGYADVKISEMADNKAVTKYEVKRIRYKIRYKVISDEYF